MKFIIRTTNLDFHEYVLKKYPVLRDFGFKKGYIELKYLTDLLKLERALGEPLVIFEKAPANDLHDPEGAYPMIEIYDDYREKGNG